MAEGEVLALGTPAEIRHSQRTEGRPEPTLEDAFIALIENRGGVASAA
jgi:ABC-2 type transport system ATP-binding protein